MDHVRDLTKGGPDVSWNMVALCPNCHALKTSGENREKLQRLPQPQLGQPDCRSIPP
ncbi:MULTISPECIES: HNH endonuclease signature motif containing protein [unclassified Streptomyces]|uniref:HNH endonuclease signature motif containing protein n=1 Tax=unclassified Streptomyces TaxID=2593676 RepID=UPI00382C0C4C